MMLVLPPGLLGLARYKQFVLWRKQNPRLDPMGYTKVDKIPVNGLTGMDCDAHNPVNWMSFEEAARAQLHFPDLLIGFVVTRFDPYFFIDTDKCLYNRVLTPIGASIQAWFQGCAMERSTSGTGFHVLGVGTPAVEKRKIKNLEHSFDLYHQNRFIALTLDMIGGDCNFNHQTQIDALVYHYLRKDADVVGAEWTSEPCQDWRGPEDDDELIEKALKSKNSRGIFEGGVVFRDLWERNDDKLAVQYEPDDASTYPFDHSRADAALLQMLSFWTGKNSERVDRLFRKSALYREKWERDDYRQDSINHANGHCKKVYKAPAPAPEKVPVVPVPVEVQDAPRRANGYQFLDVDGQISFFEGCRYIISEHKIASPFGLLKPDQFKAAYGGYVHALDDQGHKTTKNAFEVFTESQAYRFPKVLKCVFRPDLKPDSIFKYRGNDYLNSYRPLVSEAVKGDITPFINHLAKLFPCPRDQHLILCWMAATIQFPGVKLQCAVVMQGVEGNGKSFMMDCLAYCIGDDFTHYPNANDLDNKFNSWMRGKLAILVEEIGEGDRQGIMGALKALITNRRVEHQGKGADQGMMDNFASFMMATNHKDALVKTLNDRRYMVFYAAQQSAADCLRDGINKEYVKQLHAWREAGGFKHVEYFLRYEFKIPQSDFDDLMYRAPETSSTREAVVASLGPIEHEVMECVQEGRPGFSNGWISSMALAKMLKDSNRKIAANKRKPLLETLGYIPHPALAEGRASRPLQLDHGKSTLFVHIESDRARITDGAQAMAQYEADQQEVVNAGALAVFGN